MTIEKNLFCPLGCECEKIENNQIHRCRWFVRVAGQNPQNGQQVDRDDCAITWLPTLTLETARTNRGTASAVESLRNEVAAAGAVILPMEKSPLLLESGEGGVS
jgi:hypothetical protein